MEVGEGRRSVPVSLLKHEQAFALLYSAIGYEPRQVKYAMIRHTELGEDKDVSVDLATSNWRIPTYHGDTALTGSLKHFGQAFGKEYWTIDFSGLSREGEGYRIEVDIRTGSGVFDVTLVSEPFDIMDNIFLKRTAYGIAVANFNERRITHNLNFMEEPFQGGGWIDCSSNMSSACHHAWASLGFTRLLKAHGEYLGPMIVEALEDNLKWGLDYVTSLQADDGMFVPQCPDRLFGPWAWRVGIPFVNFDCSIALCEGSMLLKESDPKRSRQYLDCAVRGYEWVKDKGPKGDKTHVIDLENASWTVKDQLRMLWLETELFECTGESKYVAQAAERARKVIALQVLKADAINGIYGDFYARPGSKKKPSTSYWESYAFDLCGLCKLISLLPQHPDRDMWFRSVRTYAYEYMKKVCSLNPFGVSPQFIDEDGKTVYFREWGDNRLILETALQLLEMAELFQDTSFVDLATSHVQWIAGLHHGIPGKFVRPESFLEVVPASFINSVGSRFATQWVGGPPKGHHGPEGLVYYDRFDGNRYCEIKYYPHPNPTIVCGLANGRLGRYIYGGNYTDEHCGPSEPVISIDGLWLMVMSKYERTGIVRKV